MTPVGALGEPVWLTLVSMGLCLHENNEPEVATQENTGTHEKHLWPEQSCPAARRQA